MTEKKAKALELMLAHTPISAIAEEIGVCRKTLYNWLSTDTEFKDAKAKAEEHILDNLYVVALTELENILYNSESNYERIQCATQILKMKKSNDVNVTIDRPKSVDELLADLM